MIAIIDYGAGNIQSVYKAMKHIGCDCVVTSDRNEILNADGAILPGVGSFGDCMNTMTSYKIVDVVKEFIKSGKPFLGICLGLQLLFPESEESPNVQGLDIFKGNVTKIPNGEGLKIPHMGWNSINILKKDGIFKGIENNTYVYFVHSYYLRAENRDIVSSQTEYGVTIDASISYKNVTATQFHPEKSGEVGLKMLKNFAEMC
jgi:glutamine amidotransferase